MVFTIIKLLVGSYWQLEVQWKQSSETSLRRNHDHYQRTSSQTCRNGPISMRRAVTHETSNFILARKFKSI
jgi:hypothetical protein